MSFLIRLAVRHMCSVSDATDAAASATALPRGLVSRTLKQIRRADAQENGQHAPSHRGARARACRSCEVGKADRHDEKRFEAFPQSDDESWQHDSEPYPLDRSFRLKSARNENQSQDDVSVYFVISDRSSRLSRGSGTALS
jgi:hypothetical protein